MDAIKAHSVGIQQGRYKAKCSRRPRVWVGVPSNLHRTVIFKCRYCRVLTKNLREKKLKFYRICKEGRIDDFRKYLCRGCICCERVNALAVGWTHTEAGRLSKNSRFGNLVVVLEIRIGWMGVLVYEDWKFSTKFSNRISNKACRGFRLQENLVR